MICMHANGTLPQKDVKGFFSGLVCHFSRSTDGGNSADSPTLFEIVVVVVLC